MPETFAAQQRLQITRTVHHSRDIDDFSFRPLAQPRFQPSLD